MYENVYRSAENVYDPHSIIFEPLHNYGLLANRKPRGKAILSQILRLASVPQMRLPAALKWLRRRQEAERVQLYEHTAHPLQQSRCGIIANPLWFEKQKIIHFNLFAFL